MAGNRARERAFQIPLLFQLAMWRDSPPESGRGRKSDDLEDVRSSVLRLFPFTPEQRKKTRPKAEGKPYVILDNEVDHAFDQLEENQEVTRRDQRWEITDKGLERLRKYVHRLLDRAATEEELHAVMFSTGSSGNEQLLCVLQSLDEVDLMQAVDSAKSSRELFLAAFKLLPNNKLGSLLSFMDREILGIIGRVLNRENSHELAMV